MQELNRILETFAYGGWELIAIPAQKWLDGEQDISALRTAVEQADTECGGCGCEFDALYKRCLHLLGLLHHVAPCALLCYTCFGYCDGGVKHHAKCLYELYKGWYEGHVLGYGENPTPEQRKKLASIQDFNETLVKRQQADCPGCRRSMGTHGGCIPGCVVPACVKEHHVLYCADCPEFPCQRNEGVFRPNVMKKWLEGNWYIREHGLEAYFEANRGVGHYSEFAEE